MSSRIVRFRGVDIRIEVIELLKLIKKYGSLSKAAKLLNIPYSTAFRLIKEAEVALSEALVEGIRGGSGGGYSRLTKLGEELLLTFSEGDLRGRLIVASSHDELLSYILDNHASVTWVGSMNGLSMLLMNKAQVAGVHLSSIYGSNLSLLKALGVLDELTLVRGYGRVIGIGYREGLGSMSLKDLIDGVRKGRLIMVKRNPGSGTRLLSELWLRRMSISNPQSLSRVAWTHDDVAKAIIRGEADYGFITQYHAEKWGLGFIKITQEDYDIVVRRDSIDEAQQLLEALRGLRGLNIKGYLIGSDIGQIIELNH
ncbi:substrate-binding domain-containing protein [Caldivirga maquilingensis]|uniref:Transcriptional regulator of molybdate metabolism, LysR family n=1 Tax=Caldivirga maquilingensis (strain ATCC 700844 / DSM 13496 / JCM 10307 / IC-167) TaxID=397948 RepID=A8MCF8_CALMQ|nr:substrate-binding domain-containing protein [Caldivirga maquilingensis]ABW01464.1 transcriptional regulator of molybdate metabolism, LysR family [Caldivirga maquilingensis IC-167]